MDVSRRVFWPSPNVDSMVIQFSFHHKYHLEDENYFFDLVKACFTQRRKTLINALVNTGMLKNKEQAKELFDNLKMDYNTRGETLSIEQFAEISNYIVKNKI